MRAVAEELHALPYASRDRVEVDGRPEKVGVAHIKYLNLTIFSCFATEHLSMKSVCGRTYSVISI